MNFASLVQPLPLPQAVNDASNLKLVLGLALFLAGVLIFSIWKEKFFATKEEDRTKFLMYQFVGGSWIIAIFAVCGGMYFLFDSIFAFSA